MQLAHEHLLLESEPYKILFDMCHRNAHFAPMSQDSIEAYHEFEQWRPTGEQLQEVERKTDFSLRQVEQSVGGVPAFFVEVQVALSCEVAGRLLRADALSSTGHLSEASCRSAVRGRFEYAEHDECYQTGVPLEFWHVKLAPRVRNTSHTDYKTEISWVDLVKVRYFSYNEEPVANTSVLGISLDGEGACIALTKVDDLERGSHVLCDLCSHAEDLPNLTPGYDKIQLGFETEW